MKLLILCLYNLFNLHGMVNYILIGRKKNLKHKKNTIALMFIFTFSLKFCLCKLANKFAIHTLY